MEKNTKVESKPSERARGNKAAMICHAGEAIVITLAYIAEILKGDRTLLYVLFIAALALIPVIAEMISYNINKETAMIKHILGVGYAALYIAIMLTTNNVFAFVYVIPMLVAISVFNDVKYSVMVNVGIFIVNIVEIILMFRNGIYTREDTAMVEIQLFVMMITSIYSVYISRVMAINSDEKMKNIESQKETITGVLNNTVEVSKGMADNVRILNEKISVLSSSLSETQSAMDQVNSGSFDTAEAVQTQLEQTEQIQQKVEWVDSETNSIIESVKATQGALQDGNRNVSTLVECVNKSVEAGSEVNIELSELDKYMKQMNSIVDIIGSITSQTSLLALNASIEAARAGEAGKGFAVVASEITQMANQTKDATVQITELIQNVSGAIGNVISVSENMIRMIKEQNSITEATADSFKTIGDNSSLVADGAKKLSAIVKELKAANAGIVDSISTISAISQEVAAHANGTLEAGANNTTIVNDVMAISESLSHLAEQLNTQQ